MEAEANARLIAAAPEAIEACRMALEVIRRHDSCATGCDGENVERLENYVGEDNLTDPDGVHGIGDVLRAALEKAGVME